jgi:hypothetical protein
MAAIFPPCLPPLRLSSRPRKSKLAKSRKPSTSDRYVIGVDLGTTNCALASRDASLDDTQARIDIKGVTQVVNPGEVAERPAAPVVSLPSWRPGFSSGQHRAAVGSAADSDRRRARAQAWRGKPGATGRIGEVVAVVRGCTAHGTDSPLGRTGGRSRTSLRLTRRRPIFDIWLQRSIRRCPTRRWHNRTCC